MIFETVIRSGIQFRVEAGDEPYYPVNDEKNGALYGQYRELQRRNRR